VSEEVKRWAMNPEIEIPDGVEPWVQDEHGGVVSSVDYDAALAAKDREIAEARRQFAREALAQPHIGLWLAAVERGEA
jgi:hypothetical protein